MKVYLGIDWSQAKHDACFLNEAGGIATRLTLAHTPGGFAQLDATRQKMGVAADESWVGVETAHNLLIDFLWARGYTQVYIVPPRAVNSARPLQPERSAHGSERGIRDRRPGADRPAALDAVASAQPVDLATAGQD